MRRIDLNADVGEGYDDAALFDIVTSVNIACGGHAGDDATMARSIDAALARSIAIGAHPGYRDPEHFGRRSLRLPLREVHDEIGRQLERLANVARARGAAIGHVKPHGALYNDAATDPILAGCVAEAIAAFDADVIVVALARSSLAAAARDQGLRVAEEGFADRRYRADGTLAPRSEDGAVIEDPDASARQALALAHGDPVATVDGEPLVLRVETICCHADTPGAAAIARSVRSALERNGIAVASL